MNFETHSLLAEDLPKLYPLLVESAGYEVSLQDEVDYFDPASARNWFYATHQGEAVGFVRAFTQGTWTLGEIYVSPAVQNQTDLAKRLLQAFIRSSAYEQNHRVRFDLSLKNEAMISVLREAGFTDREEIFLYYQLSLLGPPQSKGPAARLATSKDILAATEAFSNLHEVTSEEVASWIQNKKIYVTEDSALIAAAADVSVSDSTAEIVRIATNARLLRQGHGQRLLESIHYFLRLENIHTVYLKVDKTKQPARSLYEKLGYKHLPEKDQIWLSKIF